MLKRKLKLKVKVRVKKPRESKHSLLLEQQEDHTV
jgi:hypothetical protein